MLRLFEMFWLFWPAQLLQKDVEQGSTQRIWPRPRACGILRVLVFPAGALQTSPARKLPRRWILFSPVLKSLCFAIILTGVVGLKALKKQGGVILLTLPVCMSLLGSDPDIFVTSYSVWFLPASSKPHLFGENRLMIFLSVIDFG